MIELLVIKYCMMNAFLLSKWMRILKYMVHLSVLKFEKAHLAVHLKTHILVTWPISSTSLRSRVLSSVSLHSLLIIVKIDSFHTCKNSCGNFLLLSIIVKMKVSTRSIVFTESLKQKTLISGVFLDFYTFLKDDAILWAMLYEN